MKFSVECRSSNRKHFIETLVRGFIKELNLKKCRKELVISVDKVCKHPGLAVAMGKILFIGLRPRLPALELALTLSHEMVHIKQLSKGQLREDRNGFTWMGKRWAKDTPYLERPWELEAFARQEIVLRKILNEEGNNGLF